LISNILSLFLQSEIFGVTWSLIMHGLAEEQHIYLDWTWSLIMHGLAEEQHIYLDWTWSLIMHGLAEKQHIYLDWPYYPFSLNWDGIHPFNA
jgi:hypothetical protein